MKTIAAMLLATAIVSPASAGGGFKIEKPCWNKCVQPAQVVTPPAFWPTRPSLGWRPGTEPAPTYVSRSTMTIAHSDGSTSTINSIYRAY